MDFKKATDELFARVTHDDLAHALGVSVALIRQGRLSPDALAHREPPPNWEKAVMKLAERRADHLARLVTALKRPSRREDRA
jgi:hypothetical protein